MPLPYTSEHYEAATFLSPIIRTRSHSASQRQVDIVARRILSRYEITSFPTATEEYVALKVQKRRSRVLRSQVNRIALNSPCSPLPAHVASRIFSLRAVFEARPMSYPSRPFDPTLTTTSQPVQAGKPAEWSALMIFSSYSPLECQMVVNTPVDVSQRVGMGIFSVPS